MISMRPIRISIVFEYADRPGHMMHSLLENLGPMLPAMQVTYIHGLFTIYRPGGIRPERLANLAWVYLRVALHLLFRRPDAVLVQSAPPGIQLWTVAWAAIGRVPVFCWLMDYHPEFEARGLERRGHRALARILRAVDKLLMPRFATIITLDPAMTALVRTRASSADVLEHPTWVTDGKAALEPVSYVPGGGDGPLCFAYSGNLGAAHDLGPLRQILESVARQRRVCLLVIGGSSKGENRFRELCDGLGIEIEVIPRVSVFSDLRDLYERRRIDIGIVLLSEESAGLVSPSKFSAYINFGLPLLYLGPPSTNAATVCLEFKGGFWLPPGADQAETAIVAAGLLDRSRMSAAASGARAAATHFASFDGKSLAKVLAPRLVMRMS
jgi:hypothetical protein